MHYRVISPFGIAWAVQFKTAEAAWRRVVRPKQHRSESEDACKIRLIALGWRVIDSRLEKSGSLV